jgi:hypothetical protein
VEHLHYNAVIISDISYQLCESLIKNNPQAQRCKRKQTKLILEHQQEKGCQAVDFSSEQCSCQEK